MELCIEDFYGYRVCGSDSIWVFNTTYCELNNVALIVSAGKGISQQNIRSEINWDTGICIHISSNGKNSRVLIDLELSRKVEFEWGLCLERILRNERESVINVGSVDVRVVRGEAG